MDIKSQGIRLRFDSKNQALRSIDAYDLSLSLFSFRGILVGGKKGTLKELYEVLGVTHSGFRDLSLGRDAFCLKYPGLLIVFCVPEDESIAEGIPLVLKSTGASPQVMRILVHEDRAMEFALGTGLLQGLVHVVVNKEDQVMVCFPKGDVTLNIGSTTCQDVLSLLGQPSQSMAKDKNPIATTCEASADGLVFPSVSNGGDKSDDDSDERDSNDSTSTGGTAELDYFFTYFHWGLDLLLDGRTHVVKKITLRTNLPGHPLFDEYRKCCFKIEFKTVQAAAQAQAIRKPTTSFPLNGVAPGLVVPRMAAAAILPPSKLSTTIDCDDSWADVCYNLQLIDEQPMINDAADQPFGPVLLYGYRHCVFEIDKVSRRMCSVTLF